MQRLSLLVQTWRKKSNENRNLSKRRRKKQLRNESKKNKSGLKYKRSFNFLKNRG